MPFNLNFLMPLESKSATKEFIYIQGSNGTTEWALKNGYKSGKLFKGYEIPVENIGEAYNIISENQEYPVFMIHGGFIDGINKNKMVRRKRSDSADGEKPTITDRNLQFFCLDIDGYKGGIDDFIYKLPEPFHTADYIYQYSSSYGLTSPEEILKCHLFFWLKSPVHNTDIELWVKNSGIEYLDPSVLRCAQPVYTQRRVCHGKYDPIIDFIGLVRKNGSLDWSPKIEYNNNGDKEEKKKISGNKFNITASIKRILLAENYHDELNRLALSLINKKVPYRDVIGLLRGSMEAAEVKDNRWKERYEDIERSVMSAVDIVNNPTLEDFLEWVNGSTKEEVENDCAFRLARLSIKEYKRGRTAVVNKIDIGVSEINMLVKEEKKEIREEKQKLARDKIKKKREESGITEIEYKVLESGDICDCVSKLLANSSKEPEVFIMGNNLASIKVSKPNTVRQCRKSYILGKDYPAMPIISQYRRPFDTLIHRIKKDVAFVNHKGKDIDPHYSVIQTVGKGESMNSAESYFRPLTGIVEHPFINDDWKLVRKNGYDNVTGIYSVLHHKLKITRMDPNDAYKYLCEEVLAEFPFDSKLDQAVAIAAMMTGMQRPVIAGDSGFPGFGIVSPTQSSGKTTLAQVISYSIFNRPVAAATLSSDEVELEKHLLAILQEGHSCVLFDNIPYGAEVSSNNLAKVISSDSFTGRQLGENRTVTVPSNVLWLFTGNGISFVGDFATRVLSTFINPRMEAPDRRKFKREDIGQWVMDNRKHIISALLSIIIEGKNVCDNNDCSRFKDWDKFVRKPLMKVACVDILDAIEKNQMFDNEQIAKYNLIHILRDHFGEETFTTKDVMSACFDSFDGRNEKMKDALIELIGPNIINSSISVGKTLRGMSKAVFGKLTLTVRKSNIVYWKIVEVENFE